jgi:hypothetical protein
MKISAKDSSGGRGREGEQGWALLGLLLMLSILAITLASLAVPNVQMQVQRDKELEMLYRGRQMAEGIARYYNNGVLSAINLAARPPAYGYLTELKKLRDGVIIGDKEIRFVRPSAMIDPMISQEWEPVRLRDPRIYKVLQAYAAQEGVAIPQSYLLLAGPPTKLERANPTAPKTPTPPNPPGGPPQTGPKPPSKPADADEGDDDDDDDDDDEAEDIEEDEGIIDPLKPLLQGSQNDLPIIGVAPRIKGQSVRAYYGLTDYDEWVFIYLPPAGQFRPEQPVRPTAPIQPQPGDRPLK